MQQAPVLSCDCCGLPIAAGMGEDCPRCHYPIQPAKEEQFLESAIRDLQRVATHGGANITVIDLIRRYQMRLAHLLQLKWSASLASASMPPAGQAFEAADPSTLPTGRLPEMATSRPPAPTSMGPTSPLPAPMPVPTSMAPIFPSSAPMPAAPAREPRTIRQTFFSWSAFFIDNAITVIGLLGAFLVLLGTLSFVYNNTIIQSGNRLESFLIVFGAHVAFGIVGLIASRFANFRLIARIYIIICALLLPLAGLTGYSLILGHLVTLSVPTLIAIAAAYTAIVYGLLAVYQDSVPFGYLAVVALAVADLATAQALGLSYWWWPSALMLLALLALISVVQPSSAANGRSILRGRLAILREPVRVLMFSIISISALSIVYVTLYSVVLDFTGHAVREMHFSILSMTLLGLLWTSLYLRLTRNTKFLLALAYLFLACVLAFCYAFNFGHIGYALALTGVAVLYHVLDRFAHRLLQPFHNLALRLDQLAIVIVSIVPLISAPWLPFQLFSQVYNPTPQSVSLQSLLTNWEILGPFIAIAAGFLLTISIVFRRADAQAASGRGNAWPWLLLLGGMLFTLEYGEVVLVANVMSAWWFLGLTLALTVSAIVVRQRAGAYWANPLDTLAIGEAILTLTLMLNRPDSLWITLLFLAALSYGILLYQRRQNGLFLPLTFASFALLTLALIPHLQIILFLGVVLPFAAAAVSRFMPAMPAPSQPAGSTGQRISFGWEWPLLAIALTSNIIVSCFDLISSTSTLQNWLHMSVPVALELAIFSLVWYVYATLSRAKWCLLPMTGFALAALVLPSNGFPVLLATTCIVAVLALSISHIKGKDWALPLYLVALFAAVMTGIAGHTQNQLPATTGVLLVFAVLAYIVGIVEDWAPASWLLPIFATWSLLDAAVLLGDLWRPPITALLCPVAGLAISQSNLFSNRSHRFTNYVLPLYTTALVAAVLTGIYGMLKGINAPFYGAVPAALLLYAVLAYIVLFLERQPRWLWIVAGFAFWGTLLAAQMNLYVVVGIGIGTGLVGLLGKFALMRQVQTNQTNNTFMQAFTRFTWSWPWYATTLLATCMTGIIGPVQNHLLATTWILLGFAVLAYAIGILEDWAPASWLSPIFATWSLLDTTFLLGDFWRLLIMALLCTITGWVISRSSLFSNRRYSSIDYVFPLYTTALVAAVLTGIYGMFRGINLPFYGAVPAALLLYAVLVYIVLLKEHRPGWLWIVAGFAFWGTLLAAQMNFYVVVGIGIGTGLAGLLVRLALMRQLQTNRVDNTIMQAFTRFTWSWPWYATTLLAAIMTGTWSSLPLTQPGAGFTLYGLFFFTILTAAIVLVEQVPEMQVVPLLFAVWTIEQTHWAAWQLVIAYSLLCMLLFVSQSVWKLIPFTTNQLLSIRLYRVCALAGQALVVLSIISQGGPFASGVALAHAGAGALFVLALLLCWYGRLEHTMAAQSSYYYWAGLLLSLIVPWELVIFKQTNLDLLTLAPAVYLSVIGQLLMREGELPAHHQAGQIALMLGSTLLLVPTLWLSFSAANQELLYTLILLGEALVLLLLGIGRQVRMLVLYGAGLIVVGGLHALFLTTTSTPLALVGLGLILVLIATGLTLTRHKLQALWTRWQ